MERRELLKELEIILKEDYGVELKGNELSKTADGLVSYFDLLNKINFRNNKNKYEYNIRNKR